MTTIHFDGGVKPTNPGPAYGSYEIVLENDRTKGTWKTPLKHTSNEAEYMTLCKALETYLCLFNTGNPLLIYSDSQLLVNQINGKWKCRNERLNSLRESALRLLKTCGNWHLKWNSRKVNLQKFGH